MGRILRAEWAPWAVAAAAAVVVATAYRAPIGSGLAAVRAAATGRELARIPAPPPGSAAGMPPGWDPAMATPAAEDPAHPG